MENKKIVIKKIDKSKCKHKKWHTSGYYRLSGNMSAEERTCDICGLIITV